MVFSRCSEAVGSHRDHLDMFWALLSSIESNIGHGPGKAPDVGRAKPCVWFSRTWLLLVLLCKIDFISR